MVHATFFMRLSWKSAFSQFWFRVIFQFWFHVERYGARRMLGFRREIKYFASFCLVWSKKWGKMRQNEAKRWNVETLERWNVGTLTKTHQNVETLGSKRRNVEAKRWNVEAKRPKTLERWNVGTLKRWNVDAKRWNVGPKRWNVGTSGFRREIKLPN